MLMQTDGRIEALDWLRSTCVCVCVGEEGFAVTN